MLYLGFNDVDFKLCSEAIEAGDITVFEIIHAILKMKCNNTERQAFIANISCT